jgi:hypothetical protein
MRTSSTSSTSLVLPDDVSAARAQTVASVVPWYVWTVVIAVASGVLGAHWDISWHRSIGRDAFWTPAHIAIYLKGVLAGFTFGYLILHTTIARRDATDVVSIWGLKGPLGAFIAAWGGIMMIASAPFDNWWHDAYGLDVKILSPPHVMLLAGSGGVTFGGVVLVQALRARGNERQRHALVLLLLLLGGFSLIEMLVLQMESTRLTIMHSATFYRTFALSIPAVLCAFWIASGHRWASTIVTSIYTVFLLALTWVLPLFPAEPKLGPVYQHVTHFMPNGFPLLLIVPAVAMDLVLRRVARGDRSRSHPIAQKTRAGGLGWLVAFLVGPLFLLVFLAVQWPFADFLNSPTARNGIFGSHYFAYNTPPTSYGATYRYLQVEPSAEAFWRVLAMAFVFATLSARVGLGVGQWLLRIKR